MTRTTKLVLFLMGAAVSLIAAMLRLTAVMTPGYSLLVLLGGLFLLGVIYGLKYASNTGWPQAWIGLGVALSGIPIDVFDMKPDQRPRVGYWMGILIGTFIFWLLTVLVTTIGDGLGKKMGNKS